MRGKAGMLGANATRAFDILSALYVRTFSVSAHVTEPSGLFFSPDGINMYLSDGINSGQIDQYSLATAWDITSASYVRSVSVVSSPRGVFFRDDGLKMYVGGAIGSAVTEYDLSVAWDISTRINLQSFSVAAWDGSPRDYFFDPSGMRMFMLGGQHIDVNQYALSTAWDISTASYEKNFSVSGIENSPLGMFFTSDGRLMFIVGNTTDTVYKYLLSTPWDVASASYQQGFSVSAQDTAGINVFFRGDGDRMYVLGSANDSIYEYSLS